ncbi:putative bacteriocin export ABC transporter [Breznakia pachnodae]|uniref:ABC transport system ATP-binding protein n=1 Tax=Breznakia pachnodae TaxID=265178 RepID=A0ABU0E3W2_9FIRM|nr:putative bacteriocin export ABC transporter [Breznakia pachnodae]MDQ0361589.1 putative ABC transport system ATP-binding protein [Breznakia pachnodae]
MIEIKNINKKYDNIVVLNKFNLNIDNGEMVAIVGKSGSGKSTLLNIIGLLDTKYEGSVIIDDENISEMSYSSRRVYIRNNISYLFQNYALIEDENIKDNLLLSLYYTNESREEKINKIKEILKTVGIDKDLNTKIHTLSGGEQQRVAFARTILKPSKLILADEPTGNLDDYNKKQIFDLLLLLKKMKKTIIIVTHDTQIASLCNHVINLD